MSTTSTLILLGLMVVGSFGGIILLMVLTPKQEDEDGEPSAEGKGGVAARKKGAADPKDESRKKLEQRMIQAGLYRGDSIGHYMTIKMVLAILPVIAGIAVGCFGVVTLMQGFVLGSTTGLAGILAPSLWLDRRKRWRQAQIRRSLPDALDVIVVCVEAGMTVASAMKRVAKEMSTAYPMLATELMIVEREIQLGYTAGEAIHRFAHRFDLQELRGLASVIQQAEKFGASLSQALRVHAEGMRVKRFQAAEERAQKASVKLLFPTLFCIFPCMYIVLIGPAVFDIWAFLKDYM